MKVLIIGGGSNLGKELKKKLLKYDYDIYTAGRNNCDFNFDLKDDIEDIKINMSFDIVILASAHFGGLNIDEMIDTLNVNVLGTLKVCNLVSKVSGKHFILISSMSATLNENSEYFGIYALSKRHSNDIAKLFCKINKLPLTILMPSQIYGDNLNFRNHQPFLYKMINNSIKFEDIEIYGNNDAIRNYIHVDDLSEVIIRVIKKKVLGEFQCISPNNITFSEMAKICFEEFKFNGRIIFNKTKESIPNNIFHYDPQLYVKIDFVPNIDFRNGIKRIINNLK
jgi:nucleoside-diphosphate-sugar epimerase